MLCKELELEHSEKMDTGSLCLTDKITMRIGWLGSMSMASGQKKIWTT